MPIKWTADKDQLLLLKILETHEFKVDVNKVSAAWPADQGEAPTARAITERLAKIRKTLNGSGSGSAPVSPFKIAAAPSTPASKRKNNSSQQKNSSPKRKKSAKNNEYDSDDVTDNEVGELGDNIIKKEEVDAGILESPTRRSARGTKSTRINYAQLANGDEDEDEDDGGEEDVKQEDQEEEGGDTGSEFTHSAGDE